MCEAKNLNVNYERSAYITLSEFKEYMEKDIASGAPEDQIKYNDAYLEGLYTDTKQALEGYLDGSMIPRASGQKTNSFGRNVKGKKLVDSDGNPIFSVGFGHFAGVVTDCETLVDWGMDNIAVEIGPMWTTRKTDICNFQLTPYTTATISADTNGYEGSCLKIVNAESGESSFSQLVQVEPNTSYTVTAYAKCDEPYSRFWMGNSTDWKIINNTWQKFTWDITTGTDEWFYALKFGISAKTTGFYIDNIIMEVNGENKRLENGELVVCVKDKLSIVAKRYKDGKLLTKVKAPDIEIQTLDDGTIEVVDKFAILEREVKELAGMVEKMLIALSVLFKGGKHD